MRLIQYGDPRLHSDVYIDTLTLGLRAAGANLPCPQGAGGRRWVTLKQKTRGGRRGALDVRLEFEIELEHDALPEDSMPWRRARALAAREIRPILQVATLRDEHVFAGSAGRAVMALDLVDVSRRVVERRLEIEVPDGTAEVMRQIEADVRRGVRGLKAAPRGKRSEAIRRLPRLFM